MQNSSQSIQNLATDQCFSKFVLPAVRTFVGEGMEGSNVALDEHEVIEDMERVRFEVICVSLSAAVTPSLLAATLVSVRPTASRANISKMRCKLHFL